MMKQTHKVFFGQISVPLDYFVRITAGSYAELQNILVKNFDFLKRDNFAVVERGDGTVVCDDAYQSLDPNTELLVLVNDVELDDAGSQEDKPSFPTESSTLKEMVENSNSHISSLRITSVMGSVEMGSEEKPKTLHPLCDCGKHTLIGKPSFNLSDPVAGPVLPHNRLQNKLHCSTTHQLQDVPFEQYYPHHCHPLQAPLCMFGHHICPQTFQYPSHYREPPTQTHIPSSHIQMQPSQIQIPPSKYMISPSYPHCISVQSSYHQILPSQYQHTLFQPWITTTPQKQYTSFSSYTGVCSSSCALT